MSKFKILIVSACLIAVVSAYAISENNDKKIVCYFGSWATYRHGDGEYDVENIDPMMCTHLMFGFAGLGLDFKIYPLDPYNELEENWGKGAYRRFTNLKLRNPKLKTLLAIGGWNEGSEKYSRMAANEGSRRIFIDSVIPFLQQHGFDGLDLDWEYPTQRGGAPEDHHTFPLLCAELRAEFDKYGFLLTSAVSAGQFTVQEAYDIPAIAESFHFINVMTYDFRGAWEFHPYTGHHAAFQAMEIDIGNDSLLNVRHGMEFWRDSGAPAHKLIMGMPTYGRGFTLQDPQNTGFYSPSNQGIPAGPYTGEAGYRGYNEICENFLEGGWTPVRDPDVVGPYAYKGDLWIGFDDEEAIRYKSQWVLDNGFGGAMFWSLETDDFHGKCGEESALIKTAYRTLIGELEDEPTTTTDPDAPTPEPTEAPPTPPPDGTCNYEGQVLGEDCDLYFDVCVWRVDYWELVRRHCQPTLYFHKEIAQCDWPINIPCDVP